MLPRARRRIGLVAVNTGRALPSWTDGAVVRRIVSVDHKQIGVLYMLTAGFFLAGLAIARLLVFIDTAHAPGGLLDDFAQLQLASLHGTIVLFTFGLPLTLGLAVYLVPLQIGARGIAFPRVNAFAFWLYLCGASIMLAAFAAGNPALLRLQDGPTPLSATGRQLWLLGLVLVSAAAALAAIVLLETLRTRRADGMTFARLPVFSLSVAAYAVVLVVGMTVVAVAALVFLVDDGSARSFFVYDAAGGGSFYQTAAWFVGHPLTYAIFLPIVGMVSEAVPVRGRRLPEARRLVLAGIAGIAVLALLVGIYHLLADPFGATFANGIPYAGFILLGGLAPPALAWLGQLGRPKAPPDPILLLAGAMVALLTLGTVLGYALGFPGDYEADAGSYHLAAHFEGLLEGTAFLGLAAGVVYWFPKLTGRLFDEKMGGGALTLFAGGSIVLMLGQHIAGEGDLASFSTAAKVGSTIALAGYLLAFVGGAAFFGATLLSWRFGRRVGNDPWQADTLEWYTTSPPPPHDFDAVPPVESERPLHDLRERLARSGSG
jgi:cytochrome c oxidase subunit 1